MAGAGRYVDEKTGRVGSWLLGRRSGWLGGTGRLGIMLGIVGCAGLWCFVGMDWIRVCHLGGGKESFGGEIQGASSFEDVGFFELGV